MAEQGRQLRRDLDLSSTLRAIPAPGGVQRSAVEIDVGGVTRSIGRGDMLTAAELVAVRQVLSSGQQSLVLNSSGSASGGIVNLASHFANGVRSLTVPTGVTAVHDFGVERTFNLSGNLTNGGAIYAVSSNPAVTVARIAANSIVNQQGALLTSVLPDGGIAGFSNVAGGLDLHISAVHDIVNFGTITSSGNLTMSAGGVINNHATVTAAQNLNLFAGSGNVTNSGVLAATSGNINITSQQAQNIAINNVGGILQALNGAINVRDALFDGNANLSIVGGDLLSRAVNLYSGGGDIRVDADSVTGTLNTHGNYALVGTSTDVLSLGNICITGDPTFYNDAGSIVLNGDISVSERLAILASGDITATSGLTSITARNSPGNGQGFDIHLVAGAALTASSGATPSAAIPTDTPPPAPLPNGETVTVTGVSTTGGNVDLTGASSTLTINANSNNGNRDGANVTLAAYSLSGSKGQVLLPAGSTINTSGNNNGTNGNVTIIAGATSGTAISIGAINASGGGGTSASTGKVTLVTAQPTGASGNVIFRDDGSIASSNSITSSPTIESGSITVGGNVSASNNIGITAGGSISTTGTLSAPAVSLSAGDAVSVGADINGTTSITVQANTTISTTGAARLNSSAGTVTLTSVSGSIGTADAERVNIDALNLVANASSSGQTVYLDEANGVTLGSGALTNSAGATFDLKAATVADGNIVVLNDVTAGSAVNLQAGSATTAGNILQGTGATGRLVSTGGVVNLSSTGTTGIGTSANRLRTTAGSLVAVASGTASSVYLDEFDGVTLGTASSASSANNTFDVIASTGANGDITVLNDVSAGTAITLVAGFGAQTGNILQSSGATARLISTSGTVNLSADGTTGIGTASDPIRTTAANLVANATGAGASVFVSETDGVNLGAGALSSSATAIFSVQAGGSITNTLTTGTVTAADVVLRALAGTLTVGATITGTNSVSLQADGNITTAGTARVVSSGGLVTLTSDSGSIGTGGGQRVLTTAANLVANAGSSGQSVFIDEFDGVTLGSGSSTSSAGATFDLIASTGANGDVVVLNDVSAGSALNLVAGSGSQTGNILQASGATGRLTSAAGTVNLSSDGTAGIGQSGNRLLTTAGNLTANATGSGASVFIDESDAVNLGSTSSSASATFDLQAGSDISNTASTGTVTAANVVLRALSTGAITVNANVTGTNSVSLQAGGDITTPAIGRIISSGGLVTLTSDNGSIGTGSGAGQRVLTTAANLVANAASAGKSVFIDEFDGVTLGSGVLTNGAADVFNLVAATGASGDVIVLNNVSAGSSVTLKAGSGAQTGNILQANGSSGRLISTTGTVDLSANGTTGIGATSNRLLTTAGNLVANASGSGASVFVDEADGVNLGAGASSAGATFDVLAGGSVSNTAGTGTVTATDVVLRASSGTITVNADITGTGSVSLRAGGNITTPGTGRIISSGGLVTLTSDTGSIGTGAGGGQRVLTTAASLVAKADTAGQSVFIDEFDGVTLGNASLTNSAGDRFDLVAATGGNGDIVVLNDVTAGSIVSLQAGSFSQAGNILQGAAATGRLISGTGTVTVTANGTTGIGESSNRLLTTAGNLTANATGSSASVYISEQDDVNLGSGASSANSAFDLVAGGSISNTAVTGAVSATTVSLNATAGAIIVNADLTGSTSVSLHASGNITTPAAGRIVSSAGVVTLTSDNGSIGLGTAAGQRVLTTAANLVANAAAPGQNVFIDEFDGVTLGSGLLTSGAAGTFDLVASTGASGNVVVLNDVTAGSSLSVQAGSGAQTGNILQGAGATGRLLAASGTVSLGANGTTGIGDSGNRLRITAANLVANSTGSGSSVFLDEADGVNLGAGSSAADATFDLLSGGSLTNTAGTGTVTAAAVVIRATSGTITINADITGTSSVSLQAAGDLTTPGSGRVISSAGLVTLTADGGSIGTGTGAGQRFLTTAANLVANATSGSVFIGETDALNFGAASSSAGATFDVEAGNNITNTPGTGSIAATDAVLRSTAGTITVNANITGTNSVDLRANGDVTTAGSARVVSINGLVRLTSDTGSVGTGSGQRAQTTAGSLVAHAAQGVFVDEADGVVLGSGALTNSAGTTFDLIASTAANGDVTVLNDVTGPSGITLVAGSGSQTGNIIQSSGATGRLISAVGTVNLSADGSTGIGTSSDRVLTTAANLVANASAGSVYAGESDGLNFGAASSSALSTFDVQAGGSITNTAGTGTIGAADVMLRSTGGTITVNANITGTNSVYLSANGNVTSAGSARVISTAGLVRLTSDTGSVGTGTGAGQRLSTTAGGLVANAAQGVFVDETDGVVLGSGALTSAAGTTFDLIASTSANGDITVLNDVTGTTDVTLVAGSGAQTGNILQASGASGRLTSTGGTVNLSADGGTGIGTGSDRVLTNTANLVANASAGSVFIGESNDLNFGAASSSAQTTFDVQAGGNITNTAVTGSVGAANVVLQSTGGSITVNADITGTNSVFLRASGDVTTAGGARVVSSGGLVRLTSDSGSVGTGTGAGQRLLTTAANLVVNAGQAAFVDELDGVVLGSGALSNSAGTTFNLIASTGASGDITVLNNVTGGTAVTLVAGAGASQTGNILQAAGATGRLISASGSLKLSANGTTGIGTSSDRVLTNAGNFVANANGAGASVFIDETDAMNFGAGSSSAAVTFNVLAGGSISNTAGTGTVSADTVVLRSTGGTITINADVTGATSVTLRANGDITSPGTGRVISSLGQVTLTSDAGSIGTGTGSGQRLLTTAANLVANALATNQNVFIQELDDVSLGPTSSGAGGTFNVLSNGQMTVSAPVLAANVVLQTAGGSGFNLIVGADVTGTTSVALATTGNGIVQVQTSRTVSAPGGTITITGSDIDLSGFVSAGATGTVVLKPNGNIPILFGPIGTVTVVPPTLVIDAAEIGRITAQTLVVGDAALSGGITIADDINVDGTGPGKFNLTFFNAGSYNGAGKTLTLGDKVLTVNVSGTVSLGSITTSALTLNLTGTGGFSVDGDITLTSPGALLTVVTDGDIVRTTGTLKAGSIELTSTNGSIGTGDTQRIFVDAVNLTANSASGAANVFLRAIGSVNLGGGSSSAGNTFDLIAAGNVTNSAGTGTVSAADVKLTSVGGFIIINAGVTGTNSVDVRSNAGAVTIYADVSGASSVNVTANGNITTPGAGRIISAAGVVTLNSIAGSIGTGTGLGQRVQTTAGSLVANASAAGQSVFIDEFDGVVLGNGAAANSAGATFDLIASTGANGDIEILNNVSAATEVKLLAGSGAQTGNIVQNAAGSGRLISASGLVQLTADGTVGVGQSGNAVRTTAANLLANATGSGASVYLSELDDVNLGPAASTASAGFELVAGGNITNTATTGTVSADTVTIRSTGGSITVNADLTGTTLLDVRASGNVTTPGTARLVSAAGQVSVQSDSGEIGTGTGVGQRLLITASKLVANAPGVNGDVFVDELDGLEIGNTSSLAGRTFDVQAGGDITVTGTVTAPHVELRSTGGSITVEKDVTGTGDMVITAFGNITTSGGAKIIDTSGLMTLTSETGSIGTGTGDRLNIDANNLEANAVSTGQSVFMNEVNDVNLGAGSSAGNLVFDLLAGGNITTSGTVTAPEVSLQAGGDLTVGANITGSTSVTLGGIGNVTTTGGAQVLSPLGTIFLSSEVGSIGSGAGSRLQTDAAAIEAVAALGSVFIQNASGVSLGGFSLAGAGGTFDVLTTTGAIVESGVTVGTGGKLALTSLTDAVTLLSSKTIAGGTFELSAGTTLTTKSLSVSSSTGPGGTIILRAGTAVPANLVVDGSLTANSTTASGGFIRVEFIGAVTDPATPLVIGPTLNVNRISGEITANGVSGGRIEILSRNPLVINSGATIQANGTTGSGGKILFALDPAAQGTASLLVVNDSTHVEATNLANDSGRIGFHSGKNRDLILAGTGSLVAGVITFGNLNLTTLELQSQNAGNITVQQSSIQGTVEQNPAPGSVPLTESEIAALVAFLAPARVTLETPATTSVGVNEAIAGRIATDVTPQTTSTASILRDLQRSESADLSDENVDSSGVISGTSLDTLGNEKGAGQALKLTQRPDSNFWRLEKGNVLFTPKDAIVVGTQEGDVHIPGGSAVFIMETGHDVAVYDLHDSRAGSIKIVAGKRLLTLAPGRQVVLTRRLDDKFEDVNPGKSIGFRQNRDVLLGEGIKAHVSEFSISSAATMVKPIRKLLASNRPQDRKLVNRMLTNAVILSEMTAAVGPYRTAK